MYTFKPITERVARLRDAVRDRLIVGDAAKDRLQIKKQKKYRKYPPMLQKPYISLYVLERMPLNLQEDEYFFGGLGNKGWGGARSNTWLSADIENTWPIMEDGMHHAPLDDPFYSKQLIAIAPEDVKELREIVEERAQILGGVEAPDWLPDGVQDFFCLQANPSGKIGGWPIYLPPGHLTPGFQNILRDGYGKIRKQAQDWVDAGAMQTFHGNWLQRPQTLLKKKNTRTVLRAWIGSQQRPRVLSGKPARWPCYITFS